MQNNSHPSTSPDRHIKTFATAIQALCHLTECTLATVEHMDHQSRPIKSEASRQRGIANTGIANLRQFGFTPIEARSIRCSRVADILCAPISEVAP